MLTGADLSYIPQFLFDEHGNCSAIDSVRHGYAHPVRCGAIAALVARHSNIAHPAVFPVCVRAILANAEHEGFSCYQVI